QEVRIDGSTDLVGRERPNGVTSITGVIGRFQSFVQLLPRFIPDLPGSSPFTPGGSDLPFDQTLDVATWNMEFFGTTINGFGPSNVTLQAENALTVLSSLNADIIALQEVSNDSLLMAVLDSLPGYELICSDVFSRSFETPDPNNPFPPQKLCYIYNTAVVTVVEDRVVFDEFYTQARTGVINDLDGYPTSSGASSFWSSGRLPYQLIADVTFSGSTERVNLINVHGKSGSSANDLARKVFDNTVLKDSMDAQYGSDRLIVLGDYNDDVTTSIGGGPSSYEVIIGDTLNYRAITRSLSEANIPTFIGGSGSTIDHITISNELFSDLVPGSETIYFPFNDISNFEGTTSDHLPVIARFEVVPPLDPLTSSISETQTVFSGYAPQATATLEVTPSGGLAPYSFEWSTGDTTSVINVTPEDTAIFTVLITDAAGNQLSDTTQVNVVDVACQSWGRTKVQVCFRGRSLCVPEFMATRLLAKGATLGECNPVCDVARVRNIRAWPNPFRNKLKVSLECSESVSVNLSVKRLFTRKEVFNQTTTFEAGNSDVILDLGHLQRGFYVLVVRNESTGEIEKIIRLCKY
ncbi:MAG: endonuclease/exonuclease/phosphatase family protein, partial [Bacteroidota bacterium]